jgi:tripartite-type tricarboxylate transporter receptor subunit TctC
MPRMLAWRPPPVPRCWRCPAWRTSVKPIRFVVGYAPGGPTDVIARLVAQDVQAALGQTVIVENKAGANGNIATEDVARAPADGYTLIVNTLSHNVTAIMGTER